MGLFFKVCDITDKFITFLVVSLIFLLSFLLFAAVIYRYILNDSIYWSGEVARYMLAYIVFLGSTIAHKSKHHIRIDIIFAYISKSCLKCIDIIISIFFLIFWSIVLWGSYKLFPLFMMQTTATLDIPYAYAFAALPVSALIWIIYSIEDFLKAVRR